MGPEGEGSGQGWGQGAAVHDRGGGWTLGAARCGGGRLWEGLLGVGGGLTCLGLRSRQRVDLGLLWEASRDGSCPDKNRLLRKAWGCASCSRCPPGPARVGAPGEGVQGCWGPSLQPEQQGGLCPGCRITKLGGPFTWMDGDSSVVEAAHPRGPCPLKSLVPQRATAR